VLSVVAYHLRPGWLPGGFVGVDIFFVISGFLITRSLYSEALRDGTVKLIHFWGRRIRRLMPAATLVIVATVVGSSLVLPLSQWPNLIRETVASAASFENWLLAAGAVDYLHSTALPSPFQHFWSLSVEEQFYILWPLAIIGSIVLARRFARGGGSAAGTIRWLVLALAAASFAVSVATSASQQGVAYFSTFTRAWELLIGAALAIWLAHVPVARRPARFLFVGGLVGIGLSLALITPSVVWPGYAAALPTLATGAIIVGGAAAGPGWLRNVIQWRPVTYVGDISYSLYLWHWPVIVLTSAALGVTALPAWAAAVVFVASIALAALSKRFVEDAFRAPLVRPDFQPLPALVRLRRHPLTLGAGLLTVSALAAGLLYGGLLRQEAHQQDLAAHNFPGGRILDPDFDRSSFPDEPADPIPNILTLQTIERQLTQPCLQVVGETAVSTCTAGDSNGTTTVMIAGDSHANMWLPAIDAIAHERHWKVIVAGKQSCPLVTVPRSEAEPTGPVYDQCIGWNENLHTRVAQLKPAFVFTSSAFYSYGKKAAEGDPAFDDHMGRAYAEQYSFIQSLGIPVVAVAEVPVFTGFSAPDCLSRPRMTVAECTSRMTAALTPRSSRIRLAATHDPELKVIDVNDLICREGVCPAAIGNVITYRDDNHLTPEFVKSITWRIRADLDRVLPELRPGVPNPPPTTTPVPSGAPQAHLGAH
jgi:peptidoglycan/LPS O-acetylase OafA/YrhL